MGSGAWVRLAENAETREAREQYAEIERNAPILEWGFDPEYHEYEHDYDGRGWWIDDDEDGEATVEVRLFPDDGEGRWWCWRRVAALLSLGCSGVP